MIPYENVRILSRGFIDLLLAYLRLCNFYVKVYCANKLNNLS